MRQPAFFKRATALVLAVSMLLAVQQPVFAVDLNGSIVLSFRKSDIIPDPRPSQDIIRPEAETHEDDEVVRVTIVLEKSSTVEAGYDIDTIAVNPFAIAYREDLEEQQHHIEKVIEDQVLDGEELDVVWNLTLAANAISANVEYGMIDEIKELNGVADVFLENQIEPFAVDLSQMELYTSFSGGMIGSDVAYDDYGYTGAGQVIAIIDTGIDADHQSFDESAFLYSLDQLDFDTSTLYGVEDYKTLVTDGKLNISVAAADLEKLYISDKIPFAYNYADLNFNTNHLSDNWGGHGSHVAGIAAANIFVKNTDPAISAEYVSAVETVHAQGVAPDAQLIVLKAFGENGGYDSDCMAALEDAVVLGADVVNMSLGTDCGYSVSEYYENILNSLMNSGVVLSAAVGNSGSWGEGNALGYTYADDVNMQMAASPASYSGSLAVASADNIGITSKQFIIITGSHNEKYASIYTEALSEAETESRLPLSSLGSAELDFVYLDAACTVEEIEYLADSQCPFDNKIVILNRGGDTPVTEKAKAAADKGAIAVIIVNNESGSFSILLDESYESEAPVVSVRQTAANYFRTEGQPFMGSLDERYYYQGTLEIVSTLDQFEQDNIYNSITMSNFSSWGVTGSLELKPEITAPGGNIYSVYGATKDQERGYGNMSGTSMAAPHVAGMVAILSQYIDAEGLVEKTGQSKRTLIQSLLMSTAEPILDDSNDLAKYYSVLQQGAGLANVGKALDAESYILMGENRFFYDDEYNRIVVNTSIKENTAKDGKVKAELGENSIIGEGTYFYEFTIYNITDVPVGYNLKTDLFTQGIKTVTDRNGREVEVLDTKTDNNLFQNTYYYVNGNYEAVEYVEVPANGQARVLVNVVIGETLPQFENGGYIEGFTYLEPYLNAEVTLSIPILGFFGSWTDASMFDNGTDYNKQTLAEAGVEGVDLDMPYYYPGADGYFYPYSGLVYTDPLTDEQRYYVINPYGYTLEKDYGTTYDTLLDRAAINSNVLLNRMDYVQIRNGYAGLQMTVDGRNPQLIDGLDRGYGIHYVEDQYGNKDSIAYPTTSYIGASLNKLTGTEDLEGHKVQFSAVAIPEYYYYKYPEDRYTDETRISRSGKGAYLRTPEFIVDNTSPVLVEPSEIDDGTLVLKMSDNRYIGYVGVYSRNGVTLYDAQIPENQELGRECTVRVDPDSLRDAGTAVLVLIADYAGNVSSYEVDLIDFYPDNEDPDYTGTMFGLTNDFTGFPAWYTIDPATVNANDNSFDEYTDLVEDKNVIAAAYTDGYVFQATKRALYVASIYDMGDLVKLADLDFSAVDMAVNYNDNKIYALDSENGIWSIDPVTAEVKYQYTMPGITTRKPIAADVNGDGITDEKDVQAILDYLSGERTAAGLDLEAGDINRDGKTTTYDAHLLLRNIRNNTDTVSWNLRGLAIDGSGTFYGAGYYIEDDGYARFYMFNWDESNVKRTENEFGRELVYAEVGPDNGFDISSTYSVGVLAYDYAGDVIYMAGDVTSWEGSEFASKNRLYVVYPSRKECEPVNENSVLNAVFNSLFIVPDSTYYSVGIDTEDNSARSISVNHDKLTVFVGSTVSAEASITPWTAEHAVIWRSSDSNVATVDNNGNITGVTEGNVTVTVTNDEADNGLTAEIKVTVAKVPDVRLNGLILNASGLASWNGFGLTGEVVLPDVTDGTRIKNASGTLNSVGDTLYTFLNGAIYPVNPDNYRITGEGVVLTLSGKELSDIINITYITDLAPAPGAKKAALKARVNEADLLAVLWGASILIVDPVSGNVYSNTNLSNYVRLPAQPAAIDHIGSRENTDYYYVLLENGDLYVLSLDFATEVFGWGFIGKTGIDLTGACDENIKANASLLYDRDSGSDLDRLYLAYSTYNDIIAHIAVIDVDWSGNKPVVTVPASGISLGDSIYSIASLYQSRGDLAEEEELEREFAVDEFNLGEPDDITDILYIDRDVVIDRDSQTVTVTVSANKATNALYTIAYGDELTLTAQYGDDRIIRSSYKESGTNFITLDFVSSGGFTGTASTFVFSYDLEDGEDIETYVAFSCIQLNSRTDAPPFYDEVPVKITAELPPVEFNVTLKVEHGKTKEEVPSTIMEGEDLTFTLEADEGYRLPEIIAVTVDGTPLTSDMYTYDSATGKVTIPAASITGDVVVTAEFIQGSIGGEDTDKYNVTVRGEHGTSDAPATIEKGKALEFTLKADTGYKLPEIIAVTVDGTPLTSDKYTYDSATGKVTIPAESITGDVVVTAEFVREGTGGDDIDKYNVTVRGEHGTSDAPASIEKGKALEFTLKADTGYKLPEIIAVTVGGTPLTSDKYTYDSATGKVTIPAESITGDVVVTAEFVRESTGGDDTEFEIKIVVDEHGSFTTPEFDEEGNVHFTISATSEGFKLPKSIKVTIGGVELAANEYYYDPTTGEVIIPADRITGDVEVEVKFDDTNRFTVEVRADHGTSNAPATIEKDKALEFTLKADNGYKLPNTITVTVGGTTLTSDKYTYDSATGKVTIPANSITGDVVVTVNFVRESTGGNDKFYVTVRGEHGSSNAPATIEKDKTLEFTLKADNGYKLPDTITVTVGGTTLTSDKYIYNSATGKVTIPADSITGDVVVTVDYVRTGDDDPNRYNVTVRGEHGSSNAPATIEKGKTLEFTLKADTGYKLPDTITVTVDGTTLASNKYTYNSATGKVTIPAENITGDVVVTAEFVQESADDNIRYRVKVNITGGNGSSIAPEYVQKGKNLQITLEAGEGYKLPDTIKVTVGTTVLTSSEYIYEPTTGFLFISGSKIDGDVTVDVVLERQGAANPDEFKVKVNITGNGISSAPSTVKKGENLVVALRATAGYRLPSSVSVKVGGKALNTNEYTYNAITGIITIPANKITGDVEIAVNFERVITPDVTSSSVSTPAPGSTSSSATTPGSTSSSATTPGTVGSDEGTRPSTPSETSGPDNTNSPSDSPTTTPVTKEFKVSLILGRHGISDAPVSIKEGEDLSFTLTPADGYNLPKQITVKIDDRVLDPAEYSYDSTSGQVFIENGKITGKVEISVDFVPDDVSSNNNSNPNTGAYLAVVPVLLSAEAILLLRKRKK